MSDGILLVAHGTVDDLEDLPDFVARIRRGHPAPPELLAELRRRYERIGGSPLNAINRRLAARVAERSGRPTQVANRLAKPFVKDVLAEMVAAGVTRVAVVPLAQYSAHVYAEATREAAAALATESGAKLDVIAAGCWADEEELLAEYVGSIETAVAALPDRKRTTVVLSAHSLPVAAVRAGDPYERDVRATADAITVRLASRAGEPPPRTVVTFQSQGMTGTGPGGKPVEWLGPDLAVTIEACRARGDTDVVFAPIGFLADHVEVLYDLDVEAKQWVEKAGMCYHRTRLPNDGEAIVQAITHVARRLLGHA
jgi:ferrochelatase